MEVHPRIGDVNELSSSLIEVDPISLDEYDFTGVEFDPKMIFWLKI